MVAFPVMKVGYRFLQDLYNVALALSLQINVGEIFSWYFILFYLFLSICCAGFALCPLGLSCRYLTWHRCKDNFSIRFSHINTRWSIPGVIWLKGQGRRLHDLCMLLYHTLGIPMGWLCRGDERYFGDPADGTQRLYT